MHFPFYEEGQYLIYKGKNGLYVPERKAWPQLPNLDRPHTH